MLWNIETQTKKDHIDVRYGPLSLDLLQIIDYFNMVEGALKKWVEVLFEDDIFNKISFKQGADKGHTSWILHETCFKCYRNR